MCEKRIIDWCTGRFERGVCRVLDIGSGNGHLLLSFAKRGFTNLQGIDYSEYAVKLGEALLQQNEVRASFDRVDFLDSADQWIQESQVSFDLLLDKGTFDAISLMPSDSSDKQAHFEHVKGLCAKFKASLMALWKDPLLGRFIITSCNWTREELEHLFGPEFTVVDQIEHPKFSFGGAEGQVVTTLVLMCS